MSFISITNLTKTYNDKTVPVHALKGINLEISQGEFLSIAGPSGSGKTTLLNILGGLDSASSGKVNIGDKTITNLTKTELTNFRLEHFGFVFQSYNLMPVLNAAENVDFVLRLKKLPRYKRKEKVEAILNAMGISEYSNHLPSELSGGQQQRVAIARALVTKPSLVLADEPTANLDSETAKSLVDIMEEMNRKLNVTFIFSTHDPLVMDRAHRLIRLVDGKIANDKKK